MKYIVVLFLLNSMSSFSQIWKEPFDTTFYHDGLTRLDKNNLDVKSYTISQFDSSGTAVQFDYYEFNDIGYLIKECQGVSSDQNLDTIQYNYNEDGILQETVYQGNIRKNTNRKFIKDSLNRTTAIISINENSESTTKYFYSISGKLDSITDQTGRNVKFEYDNEGQLTKKLIVDKGQLKGYFDYYYPEENVTAYCDCNLIKVYEETVTACDSTIGTFNKQGKLSRIEMHFYMDETPHFVSFKYDRKGRIIKMSYEEATGNGSTTYFRNRKGLITRIEHRDDQERVYNYSDFKYQYR